MARSYLVLSDIHLGARRTTLSEITEHLTLFFNDFKLTNNFDELKVIFIAGDLWDDTISLSHADLPVLFRFWARFARFCERKDIALYLLEGTPKHDREQGATIEAYTANLAPELKFRYVKTLSIEYVEALGMQVLFVPDECRDSAELVYQDTLRLFEEKQLKQVDIAIMHGMFRYQLGSIPLDSKTHSESDYLPLVKHYISIGHIHTASHFERIYAQGSFDRLSHGEEEPKGAYLFTETSPDSWTPVFLENTHAKKYVTIKVPNDLDACIAKLKKLVSPYPNGSYIRLVNSSGTAIKENLKTLSSLFPQHIFSVEVETMKKKSMVKTKMTIKDDEIVPLNSTTIVNAVLKAVASIKPHERSDLDILEEELVSLNRG